MICHTTSSVRTVAFIAGLLAACEPGGPPPEPVAADSLAAPADSGAALATDEPDTVAIAPAVMLVDSTIPAATAGQDGWDYHRTAEVDLDGDGQTERVVLTARVEMVRGRPAWDDGQPWQVYIEQAGGQRTRVYAQRLQLGTLTIRIGLREEAGGTVVLLEHLPHRLAVYEVTATAPGTFRTVTRFTREVDPTGETASPILP